MKGKGDFGLRKCGGGTRMGGAERCRRDGRVRADSMRYRFQFRRYRLPFRAPVRTAHGRWTEREGLLVRIEEAGDGATGRVGYGEAAPIPWFGTETVGEAEAAAGAITEWGEGDPRDQVPARCGCLRHAVTAAWAGMAARESVEVEGAKRVGTLAVAGLLPAGREALGVIAAKAEMGFRIFKWKVGVGDVADELALLDDVCAALPSGGKVRLDANGAWDRRKAERWLERAAERPVEWVEQPCFAAAAQGETERGRTEDVLRGLAEDFPTPIALDESLAGDGDLDRWLATGWRGVWVLKPALVADPAAALERLAAVRADVAFSSALETAVGTRTALRLAFGWADRQAAAGAGPGRALGYGVWPLFRDYRWDGGTTLPYVRREETERTDAEALWTALN